MRIKKYWILVLFCASGIWIRGIQAEARKKKGSNVFSAEDFQKKLEKISLKRGIFSRQWEQAGNSNKKRKEIIHKARKYLEETLVHEIFPAWMGTPWFMGKDDDAETPHQPGKRVSCSMFVTAAMQNVGFRFDSRRNWADARAFYIQRSLDPAPKHMHRYYGINSWELTKKLLELGPGLYLIGLNCHVGFILVQCKQARFIHSNYVNPEQGVTNEPVATSQAIANSEAVGYWVSPLLKNDELIQSWLEGKELLLRKDFKCCSEQ